jgi:hypothetical protein
MDFDLRGLIRLRGLVPATGPMAVVEREFPERTDLIAIPTSHLKRLHVLGGVTSRHLPDAGVVVMRLIWRYTDGIEHKTPVFYGQQLRNWWSHWDPKSDVAVGRVVWTGSSPATARLGGQLRLYHFTLDNPRPEVAVASLQWVGDLSRNPPFVVAMTVE